MNEIKTDLHSQRTKLKIDLKQINEKLMIIKRQFKFETDDKLEFQLKDFAKSQDLTFSSPKIEVDSYSDRACHGAQDAYKF